MTTITDHRCIVRRKADLATHEVVTVNERIAITQPPIWRSRGLGGLALLEFWRVRLTAAVTRGSTALLVKLDRWLGSMSRRVEELEQAYTPMVWFLPCVAGAIVLGLFSRLI